MSGVLENSKRMRLLLHVGSKVRNLVHSSMNAQPIQLRAWENCSPPQLVST